MCRSVESTRLRAMALVFFLVLALGSAVDASDKYTYPKCAAEASTCCALGKEKMASPGYMVVGGQPNGDVIVTCHHGELSCFRGNPSLRASTEGRDAVECPVASNVGGVDVELLFSTPEGRRSLEDLQIAPTIASSAAAILGVGYCLVGAKYWRHASLGCAFFVGAFMTSALVAAFLPDPGDPAATALDEEHWQRVFSWALFFVGGLLSCVLVGTWTVVALFVLGLTSGLMLGFLMTTSLGYLISPSHPEVVLYATLVFFGASNGFLAVRFEPKSLIVTTSFIGSNTVIWGIAYFIGNYVNGADLRKFKRPSDSKYVLPNEWWGYLGAIFVCWLLATILQWLSWRRRHKKLSATRPDAEDNEPYGSGDSPRHIVSV
ncbi:hypothetical protein ATCC90586_005345 [Pythium insidiosum]|nr:hypothetical protein ATCC90586_005345 [Pythium insidiosum]